MAAVHSVIVICASMIFRCLSPAKLAVIVCACGGTHRASQDIGPITKEPIGEFVIPIRVQREFLSPLVNTYPHQKARRMYRWWFAWYIYLIKEYLRSFGNTRPALPVGNQAIAELRATAINILSKKIQIFYDLVIYIIYSK